MQYSGYSAKRRRWQLMLQSWRQWQLPRTSAVISWRDDMLRTSKTSPEMIRQPEWSIEIPQISCIPSDVMSMKLQRMLRGWRQVLEIAQTAHSRHQKHRRRWPDNPKDRSKFRTYQKFYLPDQARSLEKHIFAAWMPPLWCHCALLLFILSLATAFDLAYEK